MLPVIVREISTGHVAAQEECPGIVVREGGDIGGSAATRADALEVVTKGWLVQEDGLPLGAGEDHEKKECR